MAWDRVGGEEKDMTNTPREEKDTTEVTREETEELNKLCTRNIERAEKAMHEKE